MNEFVTMEEIKQIVDEYFNGDKAAFDRYINQAVDDPVMRQTVATE